MSLDKRQTPIYFNYKIKKDFPFLAYYNDLKQILPPNFAVEVIKRIATRLKDRLKMFPAGYLRYITTKLFFKEIMMEIQNNNPNVDDNLNKAFQVFRSEITTYIAHAGQRTAIQQQNQKILFDIEDRRSSLIERLETVIKSCQNRTNNEVIPIYEIITESRLSWFDISENLKSIATRHVKRYIITDRCLISKSKAKELKPLLKNGPR